MILNYGEHFNSLIPQKKKLKCKHHHQQARGAQSMPVNSWRGIFDATREGLMYPRSTDHENALEDCVQQNVFTSGVPHN